MSKIDPSDPEKIMSLEIIDQINLQLPRNLVGQGDVEIALTVDGIMANTVKIKIK